MPRQSWKLPAMLALASVAGGCAVDPVKYAAYQKQISEPYIAEMQAVVAQVRPEHIAECKRSIEQTRTLFGGSWHIAGEFQPHLKSTCEMQGTFQTLFTGARVVAYMAPMKFVGGLSLGGTPQLRLQGCAMALKDGVITVKPFAAPTGARRSSHCHHVAA